MDKEKAFDEVKELLAKNGIEFTVGMMGNSITAKVGKIVQWFKFTDTSIAIISSVIVDNKNVITSHINMRYEDIREFSFAGGELWMWIRDFVSVIIFFKPNI